jgi:uncharacterized membrane protein YjjP (DUF1212 family)
MPPAKGRADQGDRGDREGAISTSSPSDPPSFSERLSPPAFADYLLALGGTLVAYGCPSYRVEDVVRVVADIEGYQAQVFAIPTGLFVSLSVPGRDPVFRLIRVKEWTTNLERLVEVDGIFNDVAAHRTSIREARRRLGELEARPPAYSTLSRGMATAVVSAAAAVFFRGGLLEIGVAAVSGAIVALLSELMLTNASTRFLVDFAGGFIAGIVAWIFSRVRPDLSREVIVLSGVISLVPGMTLTTALAELAQKNLTAGAGRVMEAFVTFLSILFGIALAVGIEHVFGAEPVTVTAARQGLPLVYQAGALVCASFAFAVIFMVPRSYLWAAVLSGAIGYVTTALGTRYLPGHVSAFGSSLAVCLFANGLARVTQRPAQLFQLPGMMLLVPGSFGFLSLEDFLRGDYLNGAAKGFAMLLIAGALVTGVLLANVILPPRKLL